MCAAQFPGNGGAGARPIFPVEYAQGGSTPADASQDPRLARLLTGSRWDDIVLQEDSYVADAAATEQVKDAEDATRAHPTAGQPGALAGGAGPG